MDEIELFYFREAQHRHSLITIADWAQVRASNNKSNRFNDRRIATDQLMVVLLLVRQKHISSPESSGRRRSRCQAVRLAMFHLSVELTVGHAAE